MTENMEGPGKPPNHETETTPELVQAISGRYLIETIRHRHRSAQYTESSDQPLSPCVENVLTTIASQAIEEILQNQESPRNMTDILKDAFENLDDSVIEHIIHERETQLGEKAPFTASQLRSLWKTFVEDPIYTFSSLTNSSGNILKMHSTAKRMAEKRHMAEADIWMNDELYEEVVQQTITSLEYAERAQETIKHMTPETMESLILRIVPAIEILIGEGENNGFSEDDEQELLEEIREDPEFREKIVSMCVTYRQAAYKILGEELQRFWGEAAVESLPQNLQDKIKEANN
jgi:hypothetical protein